VSGHLLDTHRDIVKPEWIDHNGHFNMGYYLVVFDRATDAFLHQVGLTAELREGTGATTFTLEAHVNYLNELREGDPLRFTTRLLGFDHKRIHYFHEMYHATEGYLAATNELMSLHVNHSTRRSAPMAMEVTRCLEEILEAHEPLPMPEQVGRRIGLERRPTLKR
jgi:acyl-CoA thioester hydrolase